MSESLVVPLVNPFIPPSSRRWVANALLRGEIARRGKHEGKVIAWLQSYTQRKYVLLTSNGTTAVQAAARAWWKPDYGLEITVPNVTFAATANAVCLNGMKPRIVSRRSPWITHASLEIGVPTYGLLSQMGPCYLMDAAQAFGAAKFPADVDLTFSFFANKAATAGEGGAFCTDAQDRYEAARAFLDHGRRVPGYWHDEVGSNGHLANLNAALLLGQLDHFQVIQADRMGYWQALRKVLGTGTDAWEFWPGVEGDWMWFAALAFKDRGTLLAAQALLGADGIEARESFPPLSEQPAFRGDPYLGEDVQGHILLLPTWYGILDAHPDLPERIATCLP